MQIEWSEGGVVKFAGVVRPVEEEPAHRCKDESMDEVSLGGDRKKMSGWNGDTLRRGALQRGLQSVCG